MIIIFTLLEKLAVKFLQWRLKLKHEENCELSLIIYENRLYFQRSINRKWDYTID